jgi:hypothetical protein
MEHGQLDLNGLTKDFKSSVYSRPSFLIIDSGWYEARQWADVGEPYEDARKARPWTHTQFERVLESLDRDVIAALVNWDAEDSKHGQPSYGDQVDRAQDFFESRKPLLSDFLLKPEKFTKWHRFNRLVPEIGRLRAFDIIGVTEKELGNTITERLTSLAHLRLALDQAQVFKPIHVFGGLDPTFTPLYFAAGAEIFDGLSWLRFAFNESGLAVYREAQILMTGQFDKRLPLAIGGLQLANLDVLRALSGKLKVFAAHPDNWNLLPHGEVVRNAFIRAEAALRAGAHHGTQQ